MAEGDFTDIGFIGSTYKGSGPSTRYSMCTHEEVGYSTLGDHWEGNHLVTGLSQPEHAWDMSSCELLL